MAPPTPRGIITVVLLMTFKADGHKLIYFFIHLYPLTIDKIERRHVQEDCLCNLQ